MSAEVKWHRGERPGGRLEAYPSAPLRSTSQQVKVLHCLTVKGQEAQRKGVAHKGEVRGIGVREDQSATQVNTIRQGKLTSPLGTGEVKSGQRPERAALTEHGKGWLTRGCRVVGGGMGIKVMST